MSTETILSLIIIVAALIALLLAVMFSYYALLKRIADHFPAYYKKLGSPFLPTASRSITKTINRDSANYRLLGRLARGLPGDFPQDGRLKRQARLVRLELIMVLLFIIIGISLSLKS